MYGSLCPSYSALVVDHWEVKWEVGSAGVGGILGVTLPGLGGLGLVLARSSEFRVNTTYLPP